MIRKCEHVSSILRRWKEGYSVAPRHVFVEKYRTLCLIKREGGPRAARQAVVIHKCGVSSMISVPAGAANSGRHAFTDLLFDINACPPGTPITVEWNPNLPRYDST
jgi:hypothetical protein